MPDLLSWLPGIRTFGTGLGGRNFRRDHGRIYLRHPRRQDFAVWSDLRSKSKDFLRPWEPRWTSVSTTERAYVARLRRIRADKFAGSGWSFFIFRTEDDVLLGGINLINVRRGVVQAATLGYWIGAQHVRQGYMTDALQAIIDLSFKDLALHRLEAACLPANAASVALLQRAGFRKEGTARQNIRINGDWQDHDMYALLAP